MANIIVHIKTCKECPYFEISNVSSTDGFDRGEDWKCKKTNKMISTFVEWHEENKVKVPDWCPIRVE